MATNPIKQYEYYGEYRFRDIIARLETFRSSIGWGELNDDLGVAIECMEYLLEEAKRHDAEALEKTMVVSDPHWIIKDHGFAGYQLKCSACKKIFWGDKLGIVGLDHCPHCKITMDLDKHEFVE